MYLWMWVVPIAFVVAGACPRRAFDQVPEEVVSAAMTALRATPFDSLCEGFCKVVLVDRRLRQAPGPIAGGRENLPVAGLLSEDPVTTAPRWLIVDVPESRRAPTQDTAVAWMALVKDRRDSTRRSRIDVFLHRLGDYGLIVTHELVYRSRRWTVVKTTYQQS
jgi:hypothetical protein